MAKRDHISETQATIRGVLEIFFVWGLGFILLGVLALNAVLNGEWDERFTVGNVPIPKFYGAGASNLDMLIFCVIGLVCICVAIVRRYLYYRGIIETLRKKGIEDYDNDGRVDSFADDFLDEDFY